MNTEEVLRVAIVDAHIMTETTGGRPVTGFLKALQELNSRFTGFGHEIHGGEREKGRSLVYCITDGC
jgi:hypothetical protein